MKLKISHLAHINSAVIEDSDLTVVVGDNGTGKTLILEAKTLISEYFSEKFKHIIDELLNKNNNYFDINVNWEKILSFITERENSVEKDGKRFRSLEDIDLIFICNNTHEINEFFKKKLAALIKDAKKEINNEILFTKESRVKLEFLDFPEIKDKNEFKLDLGMLENILFMELEGDNRRRREHVRIGEQLNEILLKSNLQSTETYYLIKESSSSNLTSLLIENLNKIVLRLIYCHYFKVGNILYLPSERNLFMDNALRRTLNEIKMNKLEESNKSKFGRIRYSEYLFNMAYLEYKDVVDRYKLTMEYLMRENDSLKKLFGGSLIFDKDGEVKAIRMEDGTIIKRELFSTKQNRLIPFLMLGLPFNEYVQIIIEEPEAHLSLKSMHDFIGFLKSLISSKQTLFLTTHSDVFFTRLNNFLIQNPDVNAKVYELKNNNNTSYLEEKNKGKNGYSIELFNTELDDLYEETLDIQQKNTDM